MEEPNQSRQKVVSDLTPPPVQGDHSACREEFIEPQLEVQMPALGAVDNQVEFS